MSVAILKSRAQIGVNAPPVTIEVFLAGGLPTFAIVGMAETAVRESKDRVRGAIQSSGFEFPQQRIIVNLGPADMEYRSDKRPIASRPRPLEGGLAHFAFRVVPPEYSTALILLALFWLSR